MAEKIQSWAAYGSTLFILLILVLIGYFGFRYFATTVMPNPDLFGLFLLSIIFGIAMFFNPCSFGVLPAFITSFYTTSEKKGKGKLSRTLYFGAVASLGIILFSLLFGILVGLLGSSFGQSLAISSPTPNIYVLFFRAIVGTVLIVFGIAHYSHYSFNIGIINRVTEKAMSISKRSPTTAMFVYGFGYVAIGIACASPILGGLLVYSLGIGGFNQAVFAFVIYALTMSVLMLVVSYLIALSKEKLLTQLRQSAETIRKISGIALVIAGLFLLSSVIFREQFVKILFP